MMPLSSTSDVLKRYGLTAVTVCYALTLAFLPVHGHGLGLEDGGDYDFPGQNLPEQHVDCFLCQVLTTGALPPVSPELTRSAEADHALVMQPTALQPGPVALRFNARAPPAR